MTAYLTARAARISAEIQQERHARETEVCDCGHLRGNHNEDVGCCRVGDYHCGSFKRAANPDTDKALTILRQNGLL